MAEIESIEETKFEQDIRKELAEIKQRTDELKSEINSYPMIG